MEIAVISGKGGTGKSCISAAFATLQERVILSDCDTDAANLYLIFEPVIQEEHPFAGSTKAVINNTICKQCGICYTYCRFDAIKHTAEGYSIDAFVCDGCKLCVRVCPYKAISVEISNKSRMYAGPFRNGYMVWGRLAPGEENTGKLVSLVRAKAKEVARVLQTDTIILDGPPGTGCPVAATVTGTDTIVIVTEPSLSALNDLKRLIETLKGHTSPIFVLINKYDLNPVMTESIEAFCLQQSIPVAGKLPFDPRVVEAMVNCKSMPEWAPDAEFTTRIAEIYKTINQQAQHTFLINT